jgi:hypothetical protein
LPVAAIRPDAHGLLSKAATVAASIGKVSDSLTICLLPTDGRAKFGILALAFKFADTRRTDHRWNSILAHFLASRIPFTLISVCFETIRVAPFLPFGLTWRAIKPRDRAFAFLAWICGRFFKRLLQIIPRGR